MTQYTLTEQEMRSLALKYANETQEHTAYHYPNADEWIKDYTAKFNEAMNAMDKYNQSVTS